MATSYRVRDEIGWSAHPSTPCCIWSVISSFSHLNRKLRFSMSLLPRSVKKRPMRLRSENEIEWHSKRNWLHLDQIPRGLEHVQPVPINDLCSLLAARFQKFILLSVHHKFTKSCVEDQMLQDLILRTRLCGIGYYSSRLADSFPTEQQGLMERFCTN